MNERYMRLDFKLRTKAALRVILSESFLRQHFQNYKF